jgi:hypothetical protein
MPFEYSDATKETGVDVRLEIGDGNQVPVTSVSYTEETDLSEVQFNTSYTTDIAVTNVSYSGSFEVAGRNNSLRDKLWANATASSGDGIAPSETNETTLPRYVTSMTFIDGGGRQYNFQNCIITSHSKDAPADDRVTESYDFTAERLVIDD